MQLKDWYETEVVGKALVEELDYRRGGYRFTIHFRQLTDSKEA